MRIRIYDRWRGTTMAPPREHDISPTDLFSYMISYARDWHIAEHRVLAQDLETNKLWRLP